MYDCLQPPWFNATTSINFSWGGTQQILFPKSIWFSLSLSAMPGWWSTDHDRVSATIWHFLALAWNIAMLGKKVFHILSFLLVVLGFKTVTPKNVTGRNNWLKNGREKSLKISFFLLWKIMFFAFSEFINMSWNVANLFSLSIHASHGFMKQSPLH